MIHQAIKFLETKRDLIDLTPPSEQGVEMNQIDAALVAEILASGKMSSQIARDLDEQPKGRRLKSECIRGLFERRPRRLCSRSSKESRRG